MLRGVLVVRVNGRWVEPEYSRVAKALADRLYERYQPKAFRPAKDLV